jgi:hypothetical protein
MGVLPVPLPTSSKGTTAHAAGLGERGRLRVKDERYSGKRRKRREHERGLLGYHFDYLKTFTRLTGGVLCTRGRRVPRQRWQRRRRRRRRSTARTRAWPEPRPEQAPKEPDGLAARGNEAVVGDPTAVTSLSQVTRPQSLPARRAAAPVEVQHHALAHLDGIVSGCSRRSLMRYQLTAARAVAGWWCSAEVVRRAINAC